MRINGRHVDLFPASAQVLGALCETPGIPVHHMDIEEVVGPGTNLEQQVSYLRRTFRELVDAGTLSSDTIRERVREHASGKTVEGLDDMDIRSLMRRFVASQRGFGYLICLSPADVVIDAGDE